MSGLDELDEPMPFCVCCGKSWPVGTKTRPTWGDLMVAAGQAEAELGVDADELLLLRRTGELLSARVSS